MVLDEGAPFTTSVSAIDPEGGTLTAVVSGIPGATAVRNGDDFVISWAETPDGPDTINVSLTVTDSGLPANSVMRSFDGDHGRTWRRRSTLAGPATVAQGQPYVLSLDATDPGDDTIVNWQIDWGDGIVEIRGRRSELGEPRLQHAGELHHKRERDRRGRHLRRRAGEPEVDALPPFTGAIVHAERVRLRRALQPRARPGRPQSLRRRRAPVSACPISSLTGPGGVVRGSLLLDADHAGFAFVKTGAPLADGDYTRVGSRAAASALRDTLGMLLDGDGDGIAGGDHAATFTVAGGGGARDRHRRLRARAGAAGQRARERRAASRSGSPTPGSFTTRAVRGALRPGAARR